jgi:hypothetical protein
MTQGNKIIPFPRPEPQPSGLVGSLFAGLFSSPSRESLERALRWIEKQQEQKGS